MAASEDLEVKPFLLMLSVGDLSIAILLKLINSIDLHPIFSKRSSLVETHNLQIGRLNSLLRISTKHIVPLQPHQTKGIDQVEVDRTSWWEALSDYQ